MMEVFKLDGDQEMAMAMWDAAPGPAAPGPGEEPAPPGEEPI